MSRLIEEERARSRQVEIENKKMAAIQKVLEEEIGRAKGDVEACNKLIKHLKQEYASLS